MSGSSRGHRTAPSEQAHGEGRSRAPSRTEDDERIRRWLHTTPLERLRWLDGAKAFAARALAAAEDRGVPAFDRDGAALGKKRQAR